jgi:hypothetical protein
LRAIAREEGITAANAYLEPLANIEASFPPPTDVKPVRLPVPLLLGTGLTDSVLPAAPSICRRHCLVLRRQ